MCLPTHKVLRNRFLERFYVGDFFYPTSKIEKFRKKSYFFDHFFPRDRGAHCSHVCRPSALPVPRGSVSSISLSVPADELQTLQFSLILLCVLVFSCCCKFSGAVTSTNFRNHEKNVPKTKNINSVELPPQEF